MLVAPRVTYPGVYIQEVESDVRTIIGVDTATTAFIGRALRGPVNEPVVINNYADFIRTFGGLWLDNALGYAVDDFFRNGGSKAVIVRLYNHGKEIEAAQAVAADVANATPAVAGAALAVADLVTAAQGKAATFTTAGPEQDAANAVAAAVVTASNAAGATVADVLKAAEAAVPRTKASLSIPTSTQAASAVVKAVADEKAKPTATVATLDAAATAKAATFTTPGAEQTAANAVAAAVTAEATKAGQPAPTLDSVYQAARVAGNTGTPIELVAATEGAWGNWVAVRVTNVDPKVLPQLAAIYAVPAAELFNLSVRDLKTNSAEEFPNVTVTPGPRQLDKVLANQSDLIRVAGALGTNATRPTTDNEPAAGKSWWEDLNAYTEVTAGDRGSNGAWLTTTDFRGDEAQKQGIYALASADIFNLLCIPPYAADGSDVAQGLLDDAAAYCKKRRAMLIVDAPSGWRNANDATAGPGAVLTPTENAAIFFPRIRKPNPLRDDQIEDFSPCGVITGIMARTDSTRGVWKAPAGLDARLIGVRELKVPLIDAENGQLNPLGINCLRTMPPAGNVIWGARTSVGDDRLASQWKYIPVRRTALFIEETLFRNIQWAVFEPNDEPLWSQLRLNIGVFMHGLFRQGAFQGQSPQEAYLVQCDSTTTTQADIDKGIVNIVVGFAPLKPAEFVVIYIKQLAGQLVA